MELHEFAKQVLFAESLEEKLARPREEITDHSPGKPLALPAQPGRPSNLRFDQGSPPPLPGEEALQNEEERLLLLHFFANHELLAAELMALALLRFPDAPSEFRAGLLQTLREEQRHTLWYLRRLEECGITFGNYPVNHFFWKAVSNMESPLDYVARLSLTFEQANLDYSRHYAGVMEKSGDLKSARILHQIYRDEITHVNYGLNWFRRWKPPHLSDWEAFDQLLPFPLSPSRAKANGRSTFNAEGRKEAGLTEDFVRELHTFERSKGRTPSVFFFCPQAENLMAQGLLPDDFQSRKTADPVTTDLELLGAFLSSRDDVFLTRRMPSLAHREKLARHGIHLPEFELLTPEGKLAPDSLTRERKLGSLCPWAWSPESAALFDPLRTNLGLKARQATPPWQESVRTLFSKASDIALSRSLQESHPFADSMPEAVGLVVRSWAQLEEAVGHFEKAGHKELLVKAPFGASGQANQRWHQGHVTPWCRKTMQRQGALVVEPLLERLFDFSVHFQRNGSETRFLGFVRTEYHARGQFRAAQTGPKFCQGLDSELARFLSTSVLDYFRTILPSFLHEALASSGYQGPLGIDSFLHRSTSGTLLLKPIVELNPRYTMGRVVLELQRKYAPSQVARLEFHRSDPPSESSPILDPESGKLLQAQVILNEPIGRPPLHAMLRVAPNHLAWTEKEPVAPNI